MADNEFPPMDVDGEPEYVENLFGAGGLPGEAPPALIPLHRLPEDGADAHFPAPMDVDVPQPAPAALAHVNQVADHEAPIPNLAAIRGQLDEIRNTRPRFEEDDERLPRGDDSTNDEILDGVWKLYRTSMERHGAPRHYPTFEELQQAITSNRANVANALGISQQRLQQIPIIDVAKWILGKEDTVAPLSGDTDSRRPELIRAAKMVLRNAGHNAEDLIDPINEVKSLGLLRGGRRKGKKPLRKGKKTQRKGKKTQRKGKKTQRKGKKTQRKGKKSQRKGKKTQRR